MRFTSPTFCRLCCLLAGNAVSLLLAAAGHAQNPQGGGMLAVPPATPPNALAPTPTPADSRFQSPKLLRHPAPAYPELAQLNRAEGVVTVRFSIDDQGHVTTVTVVKSGGSVMLDSVVRDLTLHDWTFQPAALDGKPIASSYEQELEFRLDPEEQRQLARERLALQPNTLPNPPYPPEASPRKLRGSCTLGIIWTDTGLVDLLYVSKGSGSNILDRAALRWAFTHWRIEPQNIVRTKDKDGREVPFSKTVTFEPPAGAP